MPKHWIGIIGAVPVGSIMAAHLARNGEDVFLVDIKEDIISAIEKNGITITGPKGEFNTRVKGTGNFTDNLARFNPDLIFIVVKTSYLDSLLDEIKIIHKPGQKFLVVQNGIDNEDQVAEKFSSKDVMRFVIN